MNNINIMRTKSRVVFDYSYNSDFFIIQNLSNFNIVLKHSLNLNIYYKIVWII